MKKLKNDNELNGHHGASGRHETYGLNGAYGLYGLNGACGRHGLNGLNGVCGLRGALGSLSFFILLFFLCACSNDDTEEMTMESTTSVPVEVNSYVTRFEEANGAQRANRTQGTDGAYLTTRAWAVPTDYMAYEDGIQSIGIAFTKDGEDPTKGVDPLNPKSMIGTFFYSSGKWRTSVEDIQTSTYYLYGYIPHLTAIKYSITDRDGTNAKYSKGAIMKLENVPTVMPKDLCVVIGAKQGTDKETVTGLRRGDFSVDALPTSNEAPRNFIFLLFDHLYSSLRMKMKVHPDYATLRTIKLKKLLLSTQVGTTTSKDHSDITITLQSNDVGGDPITDISYAPTADALDIDGGIEFWSSDAGVDLTTQQTFTGHFMPSDITTLDLTSVYDVYDTQGNLLRENCRATNTMTLHSLSNQDEAHRGERYTVTMTIKPTYLYMLSEPDLESPTVVMEN